ncbi:MAG: aminotransferase class I/II-fold pyridoxal phosphate-dependent enzyme [Alphaproteobacteria bacterium]
MTRASRWDRYKPMSPRAQNPIRPAVADIRMNGIGVVSMQALGEPDIIPLWFGESDLVTPAFIREAAKKALDHGKTFYAAPWGIRPLREAIAAFHKRTVSTDVALDRITLPGSAMLGVTVALQCVVEAADELIVISPVWPNIFQAADIAGAICRFVRMDEKWLSPQPRWSLDLGKVEAAIGPRTKAIFVCSPGNPTGWVMTRDEQRAMLSLARKHNLAIISDEVYGTLVYDEVPHAPSFLEIADPDDAVFVVNSFSKPWAMTGWRIGWLVHPQYLSGPMQVLAAASNTGPTVFAQYGALAALSPEGDAFRRTMLERCRNGREVVRSHIASTGQNRLRWIVPDGAFYGFISVEGLTDSLGFAQSLLRKARVGVAPGSAFGPAAEVTNESYIRICFAQDTKLLSEGLDRLGSAIANL